MTTGSGEELDEGPRDAPDGSSTEAVAPGTSRSWLRRGLVVAVAVVVIAGVAADTRVPVGPTVTPSVGDPARVGQPGPYGPLLGEGEGPRPATAASAPEPEPSDASYKYLAKLSDGTPVTWSPCRAIHYVVRRAGVPSGGLATLQSAVAEVSAITGLRFVYDGLVDEAPGAARASYQPERYGPRWAPVLVSWVSQREDPFLDENYLGLTWPAPMMSTAGESVFVTGQVEIGVAHLEDARRRLGNDLSRPVILHELGHLVGLDHVVSSESLMYPYMERELTFSSADRRGLRSLGAGSCHNDV